MDKLNLPNRKVGGEKKAVLSRYLCSAVVRKDGHFGMEHQFRTLSVVGHAEMGLVSTPIRDRGTSLRCSITPFWEVA
jgi:hypothetical protein